MFTRGLLWAYYARRPCGVLPGRENLVRIDPRPIQVQHPQEVALEAESAPRNPDFLFTTSGFRRTTEASSDADRFTTENLVMLFSTRNSQYPLLTLRYDWQRVYDTGEVDDRDTKDRRLHAGLDYDLWCGPSPKPPYRPGRWFQNYWDFYNGELTGDLIHQMDIARLLIGKKAPNSVYSAGGVYRFDDGREQPEEDHR